MEKTVDVPANMALHVVSQTLLSALGGFSLFVNVVVDVALHCESLAMDGMLFQDLFHILESLFLLFLLI